MMPPESPEPRRCVEGNVVRIPTAFETRVRLMIIAEAKLEARAVKKKLKSEGVRVSLLSASTITRHADE
jgi:hypothetical protein